MDWTTFLTSITGSGIAAGAIAFVLKKSIDKAIVTHFDMIKERDKLRMAEDTRRQALIFDQQLGVVKTALSLAYRCRNSMREVVEGNVQPGNEAREQVNRIGNYGRALVDLLYEERALLPPGFFQLAHELKNHILHFVHMADRLARTDHAVPEEHKKDIAQLFQSIDAIFTHLTEQGQKHIGI